MTVTLTTLQLVFVAVWRGCCRQVRHTHDSTRVPRRLIRGTRRPGVWRLRTIGPTVHPLDHGRGLDCPEVGCCCCSTCRRVYYQNPTLIFDLERAHDQNRRRLFKRLKNFTIINETFAHEEGVIQIFVSTCLAAHSRWKENQQVVKVGPTSLRLCSGMTIIPYHVTDVHEVTVVRGPSPICCYQPTKPSDKAVG